MSDDTPYTILETGDVFIKSKNRNALLYYMKYNLLPHPYIQFNGQKKKLARIVLEHFNPVMNSRNYLVAYADGDVQNCALSNLSWEPRSAEIKRQKNGRKRGASLAGTRWLSSITEAGTTTYLGSFKTKEQAQECFFKEYVKRNGVNPW